MEEVSDEIPEIIRTDDRRGLSARAVIFIVILVLASAGLGVGASLAARSEREAIAIQSTIAAVQKTNGAPTPAIAAERIVLPTNTPAPPTATPSSRPKPEAIVELVPTKETIEEETPSARGSETPVRTATRTRAGSATQEPSPTSTETPQPAVGGAHGVTGRLEMCNPGKTSYAADIEAICFIQEITNTTSAAVSYGWLGVYWENLDSGVVGDYMNWQGNLSIGANCKGPLNICGGAIRDVGFRLSEPGTYLLILNMCFSSLEECVGSGGDWETLTSGINITVTNWTPSP